MLRLLRTLDVDTHPEQGRHAHVASGSGLVLRGDLAYVAIDDELHVGAFMRTRHEEPGRLVRVLSGTLPVEHHARKASKPDLESIFELDGQLVGVPSGSAATRVTGFVAQLGAADTLGEPRAVDWAPLLEALDARVEGDLNVEGAVVHGGELVLLLRSSLGANAVATAGLELVRAGIDRGIIPADVLREVTTFDLGTLGGVPLGFTDAAVLDDRLLFSAAAEDTDNPYDDGPIAGSAIGELVAGRAEVLVELPTDAGKVEGLDVEHRDGVVVATLVTDDDAAAQPSRMYELDLGVSG